MTVIINDGFGGGSSGDDIEGRTPDTTNTPGNTWHDDAADRVELTGAGKVTINNIRFKARIDCSDATVKVSNDVTGVASIRPALIVNGIDSDDFSNAGAFTGYVAEYRLDDDRYRIFRYDNGSRTNLTGDQAATATWASDHNVSLENNGGGSNNLVAEIDGGEQITTTDATYTDTFVCFGNLNTIVTTYDNFIVDNLAVAATVVPLRRRIEGYA